MVKIKSLNQKLINYLIEKKEEDDEIWNSEYKSKAQTTPSTSSMSKISKSKSLTNLNTSIINNNNAQFYYSARVDSYNNHIRRSKVNTTLSLQDNHNECCSHFRHTASTSNLYRMRQYQLSQQNGSLSPPLTHPSQLKYSFTLDTLDVDDTSKNSNLVSENNKPLRKTKSNLNFFSSITRKWKVASISSKSNLRRTQSISVTSQDSKPHHQKNNKKSSSGYGKKKFMSSVRNRSHKLDYYDYDDSDSGTSTSTDNEHDHLNYLSSVSSTSNSISNPHHDYIVRTSSLNRSLAATLNRIPLKVVESIYRLSFTKHTYYITRSLRTSTMIFNMIARFRNTYDELRRIETPKLKRKVSFRSSAYQKRKAAAAAAAKAAAAAASKEAEEQQLKEKQQPHEGSLLDLQKVRQAKYIEIFGKKEEEKKKDITISKKKDLLNTSTEKKTTISSQNHHLPIPSRSTSNIHLQKPLLDFSNCTNLPSIPASSAGSKINEYMAKVKSSKGSTRNGKVVGSSNNTDKKVKKLTPIKSLDRELCSIFNREYKDTTSTIPSLASEDQHKKKESHQKKSKKNKNKNKNGEEEKDEKLDSSHPFIPGNEEDYDSGVEEEEEEEDDDENIIIGSIKQRKELQKIMEKQRQILLNENMEREKRKEKLIEEAKGIISKKDKVNSITTITSLQHNQQQNDKKIKSNSWIWNEENSKINKKISYDANLFKEEENIKKEAIENEGSDSGDASDKSDHTLINFEERNNDKKGKESTIENESNKEKSQKEKVEEKITNKKSINKKKSNDTINNFKKNEDTIIHEFKLEKSFIFSNSDSDEEESEAKEKTSQSNQIIPDSIYQDILNDNDMTLNELTLNVQQTNEQKLLLKNFQNFLLGEDNSNKNKNLKGTELSELNEKINNLTLTSNNKTDELSFLNRVDSGVELADMV